MNKRQQQKLKKQLTKIVILIAFVLIAGLVDIVKEKFETQTANESNQVTIKEQQAPNQPEQKLNLGTYELTEINNKNSKNIKTLNNEYLIPVEITNQDLEEFEQVKGKQAFEHYGELDNLNRVTTAIALIDKTLMPTEDRGAIMNVKPTGWKNKKYKSVNGSWLYNRCHLIGYQLTGENDNWKNLMTGTRQLNMAMLSLENTTTKYIKETGNKVFYKVEPIFKDNELVARELIMTAISVEKTPQILYKVKVENKQDGIEINYSDGSSRKAH